MLPYFLPEIVPLVLEPKIYRFGFDSNDIEANIRAIIEAQFLSMKLHSKWIDEKPTKIYATGGASANREILQVAADVFQTKIQKFQVTDSAALGAALRAVKSYFDYKERNLRWSGLATEFLNIQDSEIIYPRREYKNLYEDMVELYQKFEDYVVKGKKKPVKEHQTFIKRYFE